MNFEPKKGDVVEFSYFLDQRHPECFGFICNENCPFWTEQRCPDGLAKLIDDGSNFVLGLVIDVWTDKDKNVLHLMVMAQSHIHVICLYLYEDEDLGN